MDEYHKLVEQANNPNYDIKTEIEKSGAILGAGRQPESGTADPPRKGAQIWLKAVVLMALFLAILAAIFIVAKSLL